MLSSLLIRPVRSLTKLSRANPYINQSINPSIISTIKFSSFAKMNISDYTVDLSKMAKPSENQSVVDIIKEEHRLVDRLFNDYKTVTDAKQKEGIAHNVIKLLAIHGACEEMTVYPHLKQKGGEGVALVNHALNEHVQMKKDLYDLDKMNYGDAGFDAKFQAVVTDVITHVQGEESELLPTLQRLSTPQELTQLSKDFISAKSMAPSRPHPDAPNEPPQNKIANTATVPLDAARDVGRFTHASA